MAKERYHKMEQPAEKLFIFEQLRGIMVEVIVTNEFTHMNAAPERRPFKVLTPPERSTAMVIARYSNRRPAPRTEAQLPPPDLYWKAIRLGSLCAACAFAFFWFSQRNLFERSGQTVGPIPDSIERVHFATHVAAPTAASQPQTEAASLPPDAKMLAPAVRPQTFSLPQAGNLLVTEFNLSVTPEFQDVGDVELRLTGVNADAKTYDITVKTPQREFYRQDVKLAEPIPLSRNAKSGPELVVGAIGQNRVYGYLSEPLRRGHRRHRRHY